jgi:putative nucleotidyltransferase with HDIG domain
LLKGVKEIVGDNKAKYNLLDMINCIRGYDDLTYVHSMNVSLICNIIGVWFNYSESDCEILMAAGLLHDIGKVKIPREIITKPGKLTDREYNIVKMHPVLGYDILKNQHIDIRIKNASLMHHERYDGGGYPRKLSGNSIDEVSRIVAIADVYDAMTANRVYREGLSPFHVIGFFEENMSSFDPRMLMTFLQKTASAYVSKTVLLSNGEEGKIAMINNNAVGRPVVMVGDKAIDLSRDKSINIVKVI